MKMILGVVAVGIAASIATSSAAEKVVVIGAGGVSCGTWTANRNQPIGGLHEQWLEGFVSGAAIMSGKDLIRGTDGDALYAWADNYCLAHPLDSLSDAAIALVRTLRDRADQSSK